jgi:hypothetical protein
VFEQAVEEVTARRVAEGLEDAVVVGGHAVTICD